MARRFNTKGFAALACVGLVLTVVGVTPDAVAADRMVMIENFTSPG